MRSSLPSNHEWAKRLVRPYVKRHPRYKSDLESEALLALVKAEQHHLCPDTDDEYRAFACLFVKRAAARFLRKNGRHYEDLPDVPGPAWTWDDWPGTRQALAAKLRPTYRLVFLEIYGEETYRRVTEVASCFGVSVDSVKKTHWRLIRDLSRQNCV